MEALISRDLNEPSSQGVWLTQLWQFIQKIEADRLKYVGSVFLRKSKSNGNRVDEIFLFFDQLCPRGFTSLQAFLHKLSVRELIGSDFFGFPRGWTHD